MAYKGLTALFAGMGMVSISGLLMYIGNYFTPHHNANEECEHCGEEFCECFYEC